jgi:hypothetical protein
MMRKERRRVCQGSPRLTVVAKRARRTFARIVDRLKDRLDDVLLDTMHVDGDLVSREDEAPSYATVARLLFSRVPIRQTLKPVDQIGDIVAIACFRDCSGLCLRPLECVGPVLPGESYSGEQFI